MLDEEVHPRLVALGQQQSDQNRSVAHHDEDKKDPEEGQLLHLVEVDGTGGRRGSKQGGSRGHVDEGGSAGNARGRGCDEVEAGGSPRRGVPGGGHCSHGSHRNGVRVGHFSGNNE